MSTRILQGEPHTIKSAGVPYEIADVEDGHFYVVRAGTDQVVAEFDDKPTAPAQSDDRPDVEGDLAQFKDDFDTQSSTRKLCVDCGHHRLGDDSTGKLFAHECHAFPTKISLVDGSELMTWRPCAGVRGTSGWCGPEGKWWKAKIVEKAAE